MGKNVAWKVTRCGELTKSELSIPKPGPRQALIRILAISLNYRDHTVLHHYYPLPTKGDLVPCSDGAGEIVNAGDGSRWASRIGDRVILHANTWEVGDLSHFVIEEVLGGGDKDGTLIRYIVIDDAYILNAPAKLSIEETSTLPTAGLTAWNALFMGPLQCRPGTTVLTQGTGGVSCFAIQLAVAAGATVIATSSSDHKLEQARELGAQHLINYSKSLTWSEEVLRLTGGKGVDHVIDVGGASTVEESLRSVRLGGQVSITGMLSASKQTDLIPMIMLGGKTLRGVGGAGNRVMLEQFLKFVEQHDIHPIISRTFGLDQVANAFELLRTQTVVGKIVIKL